MIGILVLLVITVIGLAHAERGLQRARCERDEMRRERDQARRERDEARRLAAKRRPVMYVTIRQVSKPVDLETMYSEYSRN